MTMCAVCAVNVYCASFVVDHVHCSSGHACVSLMKLRPQVRYSRLCKPLSHVCWTSVCQNYFNQATLFTRSFHMYDYALTTGNVSRVSRFSFNSFAHSALDVVNLTLTMVMVLFMESTARIIDPDTGAAVSGRLCVRVCVCVCVCVVLAASRMNACTHHRI